MNNANTAGSGPRASMIGHLKRHALLFFVASCCAASAYGQDVFRSTDEHGVVSFSDIETQGAERVTLALVQAPDQESSIAHQQAIIDQQLAVAKSLEDSRLARLDARTRRLEALAAAQPQTVYYREPDRIWYVGGYWNRWGYGPGHPGKPGYPGVHPPRPVHPIAPPPGGGSRLNPPSRKVPFGP